MAYEQQKEELSAGIADSLLSLAFKREYPLHPGIGLWGLAQGIRSSGVEVSFCDKSKEATFHFNIDIGGIKYYVPVESKYSHLIAGSGSIPGSPDAYLDSLGDLFFASHLSLSNVYGVEITSEQQKKLLLHFSAQKNRFERAMKEIWLDFFEKYHENCFVSVEGEIPVLTGSTLLNGVLNEDKLYKYAAVCRKSMGNTSEKQEFQTYINDCFLTELALSKGYPTQKRNPRKITYDPFDTLVHGHKIVWRNLEKLVV